MAHLLTNVSRIALDAIDVTDRIREDLGDVESLAESIAREGLMQPIVLEQTESNGKQYRLLAGGRRYAAHQLLASGSLEEFREFASGFNEVPYVLVNELTPNQRIRLEIEENIKRKQMTWQEMVVGVAKYHKAASRDARAEGETWSQGLTGELLGMSQANVSNALRVYASLGNPKVAEAENFSAAIKVLLEDESDKAQAELMRRIELRKQAAPTAAPIVISQPTVSTTLLGATHESDLAKTLSAPPAYSLDQIAAFYRQGDCLEILPTLVGVGVQHIVCDPPYGIEMSSVSNSERVADTHDVESNLQLLPEFLRLSFDVIAEDGFLCMWYDLDHHEKIAQWAAKIGWRVCRWPIVWCKTSSCLNQSAQYNVTKSTEVCYVMRRSEKSVIKQKQAHNYIMSPSAATQSHPFCKPAAVWNYLLNTYTMPGQVVLDPFAGQGSLLAAAFNAGRVPLGVEVDPKHINAGLHYIQGLIAPQAATSFYTEALMSEPAF